MTLDALAPTRGAFRAQYQLHNEASANYLLLHVASHQRLRFLRYVRPAALFLISDSSHTLKIRPLRSFLVEK